VPWRPGTGDVERGKHSYHAPFAARSRSTSTVTVRADAAAPSRGSCAAMRAASAGSSAASTGARAASRCASRSARDASQSASAPPARRAVDRTSASPSRSSLSTSCAAATLRSSAERQVAKRSIQAVTMNSQRPSAARAKPPSQRSFPTDRMVVSCHSASPARRWRTTAAIRSCPSTAITAPTCRVSPSTPFAAKRPASTSGVTHTTATREGAARPCSCSVPATRSLVAASSAPTSHVMARASRRARRACCPAASVGRARSAMARTRGRFSAVRSVARSA